MASSSSSVSPKIRGACETCHRRKIRCIMAPGDTACVNCIHASVACVFAPRSKSGRPKGSSSNKGKAVRRDEDEETTESSQQQQPTPDYSSQGVDPTLVEMPDFDPLDADLNAYMCWNTMDDLPSASNANTHGYQEMQPHSLPTSPSHSFPHGSFPNMTAFPLTPPLSMGPSPASQGTDNGELGFDTALEICKRLDECCRQIGDWTFLPSNDHEMFNLASRLCSTTVARGHCPAAAMIMAGVLKSVELCGLLVARISCMPPLTHPASASDRTGNLFLLQRIDLLLLQCKVFLVRAAQSAGAQKAVEFHQHIENTLNRDYSGLLW